MDPVSLILLFFLYMFCREGKYVWDNAEELHLQARVALAEEERRKKEEEEKEESDEDDPDSSDAPRRRPKAKRKKARHLKVVPEEDGAFSLDDTVDAATDPFTILEGDD